MKTHLYRHFRADGLLLYVGISFNAFTRLVGHKHHAEWFDQCAYITLTKYDTREEAELAEKNAIKIENPRYNVVHADGREKLVCTRPEWREATIRGLQKARERGVKCGAPCKIPLEDKQMVEELVARDGVSAVALHYGVERTTIYRYLKRNAA